MKKLASQREVFCHAQKLNAGTLIRSRSFSRKRPDTSSGTLLCPVKQQPSAISNTPPFKIVASGPSFEGTSAREEEPIRRR